MREESLKRPRTSWKCTCARCRKWHQHSFIISAILCQACQVLSTCDIIKFSVDLSVNSVNHNNFYWGSSVAPQSLLLDSTYFYNIATYCIRNWLIKIVSLGRQSWYQMKKIKIKTQYTYIRTVRTSLLFNFGTLIYLQADLSRN